MNNDLTVIIPNETASTFIPAYYLSLSFFHVDGKEIKCKINISMYNLLSIAHKGSAKHGKNMYRRIKKDGLNFTWLQHPNHILHVYQIIYRTMKKYAVIELVVFRHYPSNLPQNTTKLFILIDRDFFNMEKYIDTTVAVAVSGNYIHTRHGTFFWYTIFF